MSTRSPVEWNAVRRRLAVWSTIVAAALLLVGLHVRVYRTLSPIDEFTHLDYLHRIQRGELLRQGDLLGQTAMRALACRRIDNVYEPPPCRAGPYDPEEFGHIKESGAAQHPPLYYAATALLARAILLLTPLEDLLDAGRLAGGLWLGAALVVFWETGRRLGIRRPGRVVVMVLMATTPVVLHASSTVNNDASALLSGSVLMFLALRSEKSGGAWPLGVAALMAVLAKGTNVVGVLVTMLFLLIRRSAREPRVRASAVAALGLGAALGIAGWTAVHGAIARTETSALIEFHRVDELQLGAVLGQMFSLVTPVLGAHLPPFARLESIGLATQALHLLLIAAAFGSILSSGRRRMDAFGLAAGIGLILSGLAITIANYLLIGVHFGLPARYGLSALPLLGLALADGLHRRASLLVAAGIAMLAAGSVLLAMMWAP